MHNEKPLIDFNRLLLIVLALFLNVINIARVKVGANKVVLGVNALVLVILVIMTLKSIQTCSKIIYFVEVFCLLQSTKPIMTEPHSEFGFYEFNITIFMIAILLRSKFEIKSWEMAAIISIGIIHYCHYEIWISKQNDFLLLIFQALVLLIPFILLKDNIGQNKVKSQDKMI